MKPVSGPLVFTSCMTAAWFPLWSRGMQLGITGVFVAVGLLFCPGTTSAHLELRVVFQALQCFLPVLVGRYVLIRCDNTSTVFHLNHQGARKVPASHSKDSHLVSSSTSIAEGSSPSGVKQSGSRCSFKGSFASGRVKASPKCGAEDMAAVCTAGQSKSGSFPNGGDHSLSLVVCENTDV